MISKNDFEKLNELRDTITHKTVRRIANAQKNGDDNAQTQYKILFEGYEEMSAILKTYDCTSEEADQDTQVWIDSADFIKWCNMDRLLWQVTALNKIYDETCCDQEIGEEVANIFIETAKGLEAAIAKLRKDHEKFLSYSSMNFEAYDLGNSAEKRFKTMD
ncbi:MAG: hypothetical protein Q4D21_10780 [Phascolarctobacterium sp.]|nr:hypothetical protein [Phascolarctobacterium sp.]